jgi:ketosteroid isomerase-like protein
LTRFGKAVPEYGNIDENRSRHAYRDPDRPGRKFSGSDAADAWSRIQVCCRCREIKAAFLEYLSPDAILFRPQAVNGREYWSSHDAPTGDALIRKTLFADIASNGLLGYTTGNWRQFKRGKSESDAVYGQYVTVWEKRANGFQAVLDIATTHEKLPFTETDRRLWTKQSRDANKRGWSPADSSMDFLRLSMRGSGLGGAYQKYSANDVRLLLEREPPILGKKKVLAEMQRYVAIEFPRRVALFQSADMAYTWNQCEFSNNDEGLEKGNCLHIWKLRDKKWWIVLGVYAKFPNDKPPVIIKRKR